MKHRLFTILSALSLLLGVAAAGLWVRSYWATDRLPLAPLGDVVLMVKSDRGLLQVVEYAFWDANPDYPRFGMPHWAVVTLLAGLAWAGYRWRRRWRRGEDHGRAV